MLPTLLKLILMTPWLVPLCVSDWREHELPHKWVGGLAATGLLVDVCLGGWQLALSGIISGLLCGLFLLLPFLLRSAGGGDVKMIAGCGLWMTQYDIIPFLTFTCFAGFLLGMAMLLSGRVTSARVKHYLRILFDWRYDRKAGREALPPKEDWQCGVPFGIAIACGVWMLCILRLCLNNLI